MTRLEFQQLEEQERYQIEALNKTKYYLWENSAFYKNQWKENAKAQKELTSIADLQTYPCTTKADIQQQESNFWCVPSSAISEVNTTSGTLGLPISIPLTENDLIRLAYNERLSFEKLGVTKEDTVQLMLTLDRMFMAGMAYYGGVRNIGATVIRTGAGVPQMQWDAIQKYQTTTLVAVPSFLVKMIQYAEQHGIDYKRSSVKRVLAIGESLKDDTLEYNTLYHKIKDHWDITLHNTYASTEMQTGFTECVALCGGHQHTELIVVELIDEEGRHVAPGDIGEICITTLGVEAMPLWRYKTGDLARMYTDPCSCGRQSPRISGIVGRKNQMLKIKGTTIYPNAIFEALNQRVTANDYVVVASKNELGQDDMTIYMHHPMEDNVVFKNEISEYLRSKLKILPTIQFVSDTVLKAMQFPEMSRKQIKFVDQRDSNI